MASATFLCYGDIIDSEQYEEAILSGQPISGITEKHFIKFIEENRDSDELIIRINTRGGSVQAGFLIHDLLVYSGKKITTIGEGKIFSIGTVIFLAGSKRIILENSDGLIHLPLAGVDNFLNSDNLKELHDYMLLENEKLAQFYSNKTGQDKARLIELMKAETELSASDMVQLGFATEIKEQLKAVAYFNLNTKKKMDDVKTIGEKIDGFIDKATTILNKFSRLNSVNMELSDVNGNKFQVTREEGEVQVGDEATPDGSFTVENGDTIVIEGGKITAINKPAEESEEFKALKQENADLKAKLESKDVEAKELKAQAETIGQSRDELNGLITELKAYKSTVVIEGRQQGFKEKNIKTDAVDLQRVNEIIKKIK